MFGLRGVILLVGFGVSCFDLFGENTALKDGRRYCKGRLPLGVQCAFAFAFIDFNIY